MKYLRLLIIKGIMDPIFTFTNAKGDYGKSAVALNPAACFTKAGRHPHYTYLSASTPIDRRFAALFSMK
jgi:hypothetical protein